MKLKLVVSFLLLSSLYTVNSCQQSTLRIVADPKVNTIAIQNTPQAEFLALESAQKFCTEQGKRHLRRFPANSDSELRFKCL
jgi:hypothetical protein